MFLQNAPVELTGEVSVGHHCEKLTGWVLNHLQLEPYKPGTFAGRAHQLNYIPLACHLPGKVLRFCHICTHSKKKRRWLAVNRGFYVGYRYGDHGTNIGCWWLFWPAVIPLKKLIYAVMVRALVKRSCQIILKKHSLDKAWLPRSPLGLAWGQKTRASHYCHRHVFIKCCLLGQAFDGNSLMSLGKYHAGNFLKKMLCTRFTLLRLSRTIIRPRICFSVHVKLGKL